MDRSRFAKAVSAAIVVALMLAACTSTRGIEHRPTTSAEAPRSLQRNLVVADRIEIHSGAVNIAAGFGGLWVSGFNVTTRIDPATDMIVDRIPTPRTEDFSRVVVGMGSVWVSGDRGVIYRIDPDSNDVIRSIRAPLYAIEAIAVGAGDLWVGGARGGENAKGRFVRIDLATGQVVGAPIRTDASPHDAAFIDGWLWVSTYRSILRIDPGTRSVEQVPATHEPGSLASGAGNVWSTASSRGSDGEVVRIDPATARVVASIPVRRAIGVAFGDGHAWVMTMPPSRSPNVFLPSRKHPGTVVRIDPGTDRVVGSPVQVPGLQPISVAFASGSAWIADYYDATVSRVSVLQPVGEP